MQLLKIELQGFKSFADKTTIAFDTGITAIVGPNGSGKSNISDAVRWVMGEQNVRQLRGQKAEDIIFAGTASRRPQGAAEVSLYFDNRDHALDIEFSEVVVTRRLFRSGESEFYINKRPCRLKDIHQLFADTGIGQDSMAVIGQNRVDRILNSRPEERRIIFEEVAGISRYKGRKQEGLRKIAETERNVERIRDMISMLDERMEPMAEQARKLDDFRRLDGERISYEGTLALQELRNSERLLAKAENTGLTAAAEQKQAEQKLAALEKQRRLLLQSMEQEGEQLRRLDETSAAAHHELDGLNSRREACRQRLEVLAERRRDLQEEEALLTRKKQAVKDEAQRLAAQEAAKETELAAAEKGLALTKSLYRAAETAAQEAQRLRDEAAAADAQQQQQLFSVRRDIVELRRRLQDNSSRGRDIQAQTEEQRRRHEEALARRNEAESRLQNLQDEEARMKQAAHTCAQERQRCEQQLAQAEAAWRQLRSTADSLDQRIRVLTSMEQEGLGRPVKTILAAAAPWRADVHGVVGELFHLPSTYATALDTALGAAARYVVTGREETARKAITYLQSRRAGRTTFLPLQTIRRRSRTGEEERAVQEPGILGFANDLITYDAAYDAVFSFLLGKTLIADSMESGSATARKYGYRLRIVCLDGTQFNAGGSLTGGSAKGKEASFISRRALLDELKEQAAQAQDALQYAEASRKSLQQDVQRLQAAAAAQQKAWQAHALTLQKTQWQRDEAVREEAHTADALHKLDAEAETHQELRARIQADIVEAEQKEQELAAHASDQTEEREASLRKASAEAERCRQALTEQQIAAATLTEQMHHLREQSAQNQTDQKQQEADQERYEQRREALQRQQEETETLLAELVRSIAEKEKEVCQKDDEKERFYQTRDQSFRKNKELDAALQEARQTEAMWSQKTAAAQVQQEKYASDVRRGEELLAQQGLTRQEAMERRCDGSLKELHERVGELKRRIAGLGQINPNADEEYRAAQQQQEFYHTQCQDLLESRTKLEAVVAELDEAMASQFRSAFQEINGHFQQIFSRLFGGGGARVFLTDREHILASGVEIRIEPPGKKPQTLSLLSGGERALTVIALLLAFLAYHPAPFCLVDEVDAALDEANVERMARYLKNYSGHTQFIVITHRRKTMEAANTLQGVTMEERGVSRLLTVKVDEVLEKGR
ncbi:chromosome segregation protein SMC [uncultured Megasphaera sp.]|uniref:chromosome segregation protein SMC n=1 Tax=uncultured Megasphaera sp. TaxID=165188 RepID=UPI00265915A1|nr:chromosome segregation protein SMC [uncultured Megasphaera sp.]